MLGAGAAISDPVEIDGRDEALAECPLDLGSQVEHVNFGLYGGEEESDGGDQLRGHTFGLLNALTGSCRQVGLFGQLLQTPPTVLEALGDTFGRLCLPSEQIVGMIDATDLAHDLARLGLLCLRLFLLPLVAYELRESLLNVLLERRGSARRALRLIGRAGLPLCLQLRLCSSHLLFGLANLAGQIQAGGLRDLMLNMKDVRRMVRPEIRFDMPQQSLGLITGALDDLHRQIPQGRLQRLRPGRR